MKQVVEPTAMSLATVGKDYQPSVRVVLFKGILHGGFSFFTNYEGRKGQELITHQQASLNFFWPTLEQQIRIEGHVIQLSRTENEAYFKTRPRISQIGAWASRQSQEIPNIEHLQARFAEFEKSFDGQEVPCPANWGGYVVRPQNFEFWFGRQGRLHERYCYEKQDRGWRTFMRSP